MAKDWQWKIEKDPTVRAVVIDLEHATIRLNPALAMVRLESKKKLYIYQWDMKQPDNPEGQNID